MFSPQRENYDQVPYIAWKGQTFQQVTSTLQRNLPRSDDNMIMTRKMRNPLKIYRREIVTQPPTGTTCNRSSVTIAEAMDRPNGAMTLSVNSPTTATGGGALSTLDIHLTSNTTERPGTCAGFTPGMCQDPASNALRRVRSAGMIKRNTSDSAVPKYFTDKQQYLANRGLGYQQNEFHFLRTDVANSNATVKPGSTTDSVNNTFYGNVSLNSCPGNPNKYIPSFYKPNNPGYAQQGGVSASARSATLKYNTIVTAAATTARAFGPSTASALSYGTVSNSPNGVTYSLKAKTGYPNKQTPKFPPAGLSGPVTACCFVPPKAQPA
jgi:flagellar capping protein FliD